MLTIGPFRVTEIEKLKTILEGRHAQFEMYADEDLRDKLMAEFHANTTMNPRTGTGSLDLRYIFFELDPNEFEKAKFELEKLGITPPSDGSWELAEDEESQGT